MVNGSEHARCIERRDAGNERYGEYVLILPRQRQTIGLRLFEGLQVRLNTYLADGLWV